MTTTIQLASGATEADIMQALSALPQGGTLVLPAGETIAIRTGISIDVTSRDITLDLNGSTLVKAANVTVITGTAQHDPAVSVSLGLDASGNTTASYSKLPAALTAGSWVKLVADNALPGDLPDGNGLPTRMGQAMEVLSVDGNTVTFKGGLIDQSNYTANVRSTTYIGGNLVVKNGEVVGDQTHTTWNSPLVQMRSLVDARVEDLVVRDGVGRGINVVDGVNNHITDVTVKNMIDGGSAALGIGVSSLSSTGTTINGYYAENVTHAADDNAMGIAANSAYVVQYGGDIGMHVENAVAYGTRNFAFSWHSEAVQGSFEKVMAFDSYGFLMARGIGGVMVDTAGGANNVRGVMFYEYGSGDARDITLDGITLKETQNYAIFSANSPHHNAIINSFFESVTGNLASAEAVTVANTVFVKTTANPDDVITGTASANLLLGGKGVDRISGGEGDDYIWGGAGADILTGDAGRDRFAYHLLSEGGDTITDFEATPSGDVIDLSTLAAKYGWQDGDAIANGYVRFVQDGANVRVEVDVTGSGQAFTAIALLIGKNAAQLSDANIRTSLSSDDSLQVMAGGEGDDVLEAFGNVHQLIGNGGNDQLIAMDRDTILEGGSGNDLLTGRSGNDLLDGGTGGDLMSGGAGNDSYVVDAVSDSVIELPGGGYDRIMTGIQLGALASDVEALTLTGTGNLAATGNALDNEIVGNSGNNQLQGGAGNDTLYGNAGNDTLDGGTGSDLLVGGTGNDIYYVDSASDVVTEEAGGGFDQLITSVQLSGPLAANVESLTLAGTAALNAEGNELNNMLIGNAGDNWLKGGAGNDTFYGCGGNDTLEGGTGDDTYNVANGVTVIEAAGAGFDRMITAVQLAGPLADNVEALTLSGTASLSGTGNALDNEIIGNAADNGLFGDAGNDTLNGGAGNDVLDGGTGTDVMIGGAGDDTYYVDATTDSVVELAGGGFDRIMTGIQLAGALAANVEGITLTGSGALSATGNELDNSITGNDGVNTLSGGAGKDVIAGWAGNDTLNGGEGDDKLFGGAGNDNINGDAGNDMLFGGDGDDRMLGGDGDDVFEGGLGADTLSGGTGNDTASYACSEIAVTADLSNAQNNAGGAAGDYFSSIERLTGSRFDDVLTGNQSVNVLDGGAGADRLSGGAGNDTLYGASGADWLDGGAGKDVLSGGDGNDAFYFASLTEAGDTITDFAAGLDKICMSRTGFGLSTMADLAFIAGGAATSAKATLLYNAASGQLSFDADGTGSGKAALLATLDTRPALSLNDIALV